MSEHDERHARAEAERAAKREAERPAREARIAAALEMERVRAERIAAAAKLATERNAWLIDALASQRGRFVELMRVELSRRPLTSLPMRARSILMDLYARTKGRRNSKAYMAALDEFYAKQDEESSPLS